MKTRFAVSSSLVRFLIIPMALIEVSVFAEPRTFKNAAGKEIVAEPVSHDGNGSLELKRSDGNTFEVKVADLSLDDQQFLLEWMKANPPKVDYRFEFEVAATKVSGVNSRQLSGYKNVKNELWIYSVGVSNLARQTVKGLKAEYRVFIINAADGQFSSGEGIKEGFIAGSAVIDKELRFNEKFEFGTVEIEIDKVSYDWSFSRDERYKDALRGIMIRIKDSSGKVVQEFISTNASMKGKTWDTVPASREIKQKTD